jgi:hypothetical protein
MVATPEMMAPVSMSMMSGHFARAELDDPLVTGQQLAMRRQKLLEQFTGLAPSGNSPRSHGATGKASSLSNSFFVFTSGSKAVA